MAGTPTPTYDALARHWLRLHRLGHLGAIADWDRSSFMPSAGNEARAAALAELETLLHRLRTEPTLDASLGAAEAEPLADADRANVREMRRQWRSANALPEALVEKRSLASARCEHAWRTQRPANDWAGFAAHFEPLLALVRESADRLSQQQGIAPYDALIDQYEPGATTAAIDAVFGELQTWLADAVRRIVARQAAEPAPIEPAGPFPVEAQRAVGRAAMEALGFDFAAGRLDESAHPFCGGVPEDVRLTTRYREGDLLQGLFGTIHETGHARYEQNLPRASLGQPVALARSMALHESQSLSFEMQLARSPAFCAVLAPLLVRHLGAQPAFEPANLARLVTRVRPGRIRTEADEATYPLHIILRYGLEKRLIAGELAVADIPAAWDEGMQRLLGLDTRGDHRDGALQDVHWPLGLLGYFPCYTLGALYAAQWFAAMREEAPDLDARIATGDASGVFDWLRERIWRQGSRWTTAELVQRASGGPLDPAHFRRHVERRYLA